ncbi:hypothetical protein ACRBEV_21515 [Methylobacterium phyllosphaerae]
MGKIPDDDLLKLEEMLTSRVSDRDMAADAAIKRRETLALDCQARGFSVTRKRVLKAVAEDRAELEKLTPHMFRLSGEKSRGMVPAIPMPQKLQGPLAKDERAALEAEFPNMFKKH